MIRSLKNRNYLHLECRLCSLLMDRVRPFQSLRFVVMYLLGVSSSLGSTATSQRTIGVDIVNFVYSCSSMCHELTLDSYAWHVSSVQ